MSTALHRVIRSECQALPKGWIREESLNHSNNIGGRGNRSEICYIAPNGKKVRNKNDLAKVLGSNFDLVTFDYASGRINPLLVRTKTSEGNKRKSIPNGNRQISKIDLAKDVKSEIPPIRQTASIFKQPVTVHKSQRSGSKVKSDKQAAVEKPRQIFWEKRLSSCHPSYPDDDFQTFKLPENFKPVGPGIEPECVLASISTALHIGNGAIIGQGDKKVQENLSVYLDPDQPLMSSVDVSQADIDKQEARVRSIRLKLSKALEALGA